MNDFLKGQEDLPAILLLHSLSDTNKVMSPLARALNQAGYTVYYPTFSGHGTGEFTSLFEVGMKTWLEDGERFLQHLREQGYIDIIVGGLSLGGLVAVHLATEHPDLKALFTLAAPMLGDMTTTKVPLYIRQQYYQALPDTPTPEDRVKAKKYFDRLDEQLLEINQWMEDIFPHLFELELPVFIAQGLRDEVIDPKWAPRFQRSLRKASEVDLHLYETGSHYLVTAPTRDLLLDDLNIFIKNIL